MRDILITGLYGQLGRALEREASKRNLDVTGRDMDTLDITDPDAVRSWISEEKPRTVVNCAAYTAVDDCEDHEADALAVNGTAVGHLAEACNLVGARFIHVSTDYVFAGDGDKPYLESDPVAPASAYGRTKLAGEKAAQKAERHAVVRTAWLYGVGGRNFVEAIRNQVKAGRESLKVVADQTGNPTFCTDLARAILGIDRADADGVFHAVNSGTTTWHGFATEIVRLMHASVDVIPVSTDEFPRPAPRPAYSVLDTSRLTAVVGSAMPDWRDALARYMDAACES